MYISTVKKRQRCEIKLPAVHSFTAREDKKRNVSQPSDFFCPKRMCVFFSAHFFDRVSSGRGQKAESGESHYQKRRAQIANWRRLSGARVCASGGAEVGKNGNDGCAGWQTLLLRPFALHCTLRRVNHRIQIATFAAVHHRVTPIKCKINYTRRPHPCTL